MVVPPSPKVVSSVPPGCNRATAGWLSLLPSTTILPLARRATAVAKSAPPKSMVATPFPAEPRVGRPVRIEPRDAEDPASGEVVADEAGQHDLPVRLDHHVRRDRSRRAREGCASVAVEARVRAPVDVEARDNRGLPRARGASGYDQLAVGLLGHGSCELDAAEVDRPRYTAVEARVRRPARGEAGDDHVVGGGAATCRHDPAIGLDQHVAHEVDAAVLEHQAAVEPEPAVSRAVGLEARDRPSRLHARLPSRDDLAVRLEPPRRTRSRLPQGRRTRCHRHRSRCRSSHRD